MRELRLDACKSPRALACSVLTLTLALSLNSCFRAEGVTDPRATITRLVRLLDDQDPQVRLVAAQALGKIANPETVAALLPRLQDPDPAVRAMSAWALGQFGEDLPEDAILTLARWLDDPSPVVKRAVAEALGRARPTPALAQVLIDRLGHGDRETRRAAAQALIWLDTPLATQALIQALGDPDTLMRQLAVAALGELAETRSLPAIQERLLTDPDSSVRSEAAFRLGKFGDRTVVSALRRALARDPDRQVRRWASWALAELNQTPPSPPNQEG